MTFLSCASLNASTWVDERLVTINDAISDHYDELRKHTHADDQIKRAYLMGRIDGLYEAATILLINDSPTDCKMPYENHLGK